MSEPSLRILVKKVDHGTFTKMATSGRATTVIARPASRRVTGSVLRRFIVKW